MIPIRGLRPAVVPQPSATAPKRRRVQRPSEPWTRSQDACLRKLWGQGLSASAIVAALGGARSRSAVIGRAYRLGLARRPNPTRRAPR